MRESLAWHTLTVPKSGRKILEMENFSDETSDTVMHSGLEMLMQQESPLELPSDMASMSSDSGERQLRRVNSTSLERQRIITVSLRDPHWT